MATYVVGDIQGCFEPLLQLLKQIQFDETHDVLWSTGDLVNRGPHSLEVLRFFKSLGDRHKTVLGNHDLHLLSVAYGASRPKEHDTLDAILAAPDKEVLIDWLRYRPLLLHERDHVLVHAGLAPGWTLAEAKACANEVEAVLQGDRIMDFLSVMYGNEPDRWHHALSGADRLRCIVNHFTRMRYCYADGRLNLSYKGTIADKPEDIVPWFELPTRANADINIVFGHWASLNGETSRPHLFPLDTGCVWGNCLTAMRLEDGERFSVTCGR